MQIWLVLNISIFYDIQEKKNDSYSYKEGGDYSDGAA